MKRVFYKVGFALLIVAAVLAITGGVASAAGSDNNIILKAIDGVKTIVTDIQTEIAGLNTKVDGMTNTETVSGTISSNLTAGGKYKLFGDPNGPIMHVSVTISEYDWIDTGDAQVRIECRLPDGIMRDAALLTESDFVEGTGVTTTVKAVTVDFNANFWQLYLYPGSNPNDGAEDGNVHFEYVATMTTPLS